MDKENKKTEVDKAAGKPKKPVKASVRFGLRFKVSIAISILVTLIIVTFTLYYIWRETNLLKEQTFMFVKRELVHLANTAQDSIGIDELAIINAIQGLKQIDYLNHAFVLNNDQTIIQFYDKSGKDSAGKDKFELGKVLDDKIVRKLTDPKKTDEIIILSYPDPGDRSGIIYDFSKTVFAKIIREHKDSKEVKDKKPIGSVIIGISDSIIRKEILNMIYIIIPLSLALLVIAIVGSVILAGIIIRPIRVLSHGAAAIGQGDFDYRIKINSRDELGMLASEFNIMTTMIKEAKNKEIESRLMEEQLELAKEIQEGLNPSGFYNKNGIQMKGFTKAAKGVGGDYFDYKDIDDHRVCALISDVSGKGVPASLVMVMIRTVFTSYLTRKDIDCSKVVTAINASLSADFAIDKFATLFFMIYDRESEYLSFANAGHGPLLCFRSSINKCSNTTIEGVPIGIMEDAEYRQGRVKINPGDMVIMHTDGVSEMRNIAREEYGVHRLHNFMIANNTMNAKDFTQLLITEIDEFKGDAPPHDDETFLVFKREK